MLHLASDDLPRTRVAVIRARGPEVPTRPVSPRLAHARLSHSGPTGRRVGSPLPRRALSSWAAWTCLVYSLMCSPSTYKPLDDCDLAHAWRLYGTACLCGKERLVLSA